MSASSRFSRIGMRTVALGYLAALLVVPLAMVFFRTFEDGFAGPWEAVTSPDGLHAFYMTLLCVGIAVPLNTIFGVRTVDPKLFVAASTTIDASSSGAPSRFGNSTPRSRLALNASLASPSP